MAEFFEFRLRRADLPDEERVIKKFGLGTHVQNVIDSECIRLMTPYIPIDTGALRDNAVLNTDIGSGTIFTKGPYARKQYYIPMNHDQGTQYWFEEMKKNGGVEAVLNAARKAVRE